MIENQATDFAKTVRFLSGKFHKFEADGKLKEEIIKGLHAQVSVFQDNLGKGEVQVHQNAQYLRRNSRGIKKEKIKTHKINTIKEEIDKEFFQII